MLRERDRAPADAAARNIPKNRADRLGDIIDEIETVRLYSHAVETLAAVILQSCMCPPPRSEPLLALQQLISNRLALIARTIEQEASHNAL